MNPTAETFANSVLWLLGKGALWLMLCMLLHGCRPRWAPSWKLCLIGLILISLSHFLPSSWSWNWSTTRTTEVTESPNFRQELSDLPIATTNNAVSPAISSSLISQSVSWREWFLLVWLGGTLGLVVWLVHGFLVVRRWRKSGRKLEDGIHIELLREECLRIKISNHPDLIVHPEIHGPCTAGCLRPVILLPLESVHWTEEVFTLVLRHELSHIYRHDACHGIVRGLALAVHWLNPLAWLAITRSRKDEEFAADQTVIASGTEAHKYAAILLQIARISSTKLHPHFTTAMAHPSNLEQRIRRIMQQNFNQLSPGRFATFGIAAALIVAGLIGCSHHRSAATNSDFNFLSGDVTPIPSIDVKELNKLISGSVPSGKKVSIKIRVIDQNGNELTVPPVPWPVAQQSAAVFSTTFKVYPKQHFKHESLVEFPFPTEFDLPVVSSPKSISSFPVTPTTPTVFATRELGWELDIPTLRTQGAFYVITGTFRETTFDGFIRNAGEAYSTITAESVTALGNVKPVVLTENKSLSPTFSTRETPISAAVLPGKTYRIRLNLRQQNAFLEVTCE